MDDRNSGIYKLVVWAVDFFEKVKKSWYVRMGKLVGKCDAEFFSTTYIEAAENKRNSFFCIGWYHSPVGLNILNLSMQKIGFRSVNPDFLSGLFRRC